MVLLCFQQHSFCHHGTVNQVRNYEDMTEQFHLFRVFDFARTPPVYILTGLLRANCWLEPMLLPFTLAGRAVVAAEELVNVQERHDPEVEGIQARPLDRKATVATRGVQAFQLDSDLGQFVKLWVVPRFGVDANKVVALVVRRGLVSQDVPPLQVAHDEELRTGRDDRKAEELFLGRYVGSPRSALLLGLSSRRAVYLLN
jgi:hypothetical protein